MKLYKWLQYSFTKELVNYIKTGKIPDWATRAPSVTKWGSRASELESLLYSIMKSVDYGTSSRYQEYLKLANDSEGEYYKFVTERVCPIIKDISKYAALLKERLYERHKLIRKEYRKHQDELLENFEEKEQQTTAVKEILSEETMYIESKLQKELSSYIMKFEQFCEHKLSEPIASLKVLSMIDVPKNYHKTFEDYVKAKRSYTDAHIIKTVSKEL